MSAAALLFCLFSVIVVSNAHSNMGLIRKIITAHPELPTTPATRPPVARTPAVRTDSDCATTNYNLGFWKRVDPSSTSLLGNWNGHGSVKIMDKVSGAVYLTENLRSTWNVTFDDVLGRIDWIDNTATGSASFTNDLFHRYLTPGGNLVAGWYTCTNLDDASTAGAIDREMVPFPDLSTSYSVLTNKATGAQLSDCTYHLSSSETNYQVNCHYYDGLSSFVPPGITVQYSISMNKDA